MEKITTQSIQAITKTIYTGIEMLCNSPQRKRRRRKGRERATTGLRLVMK